MISSRDIPGVGWAAGIERLMDLISIKDEKSELDKKILFAVQDESYLSNNRILKQLNIDTSNINFKEVFIVMCLSISLTLIASIFPAWKASKISPAEALRYE